MSPIKENERSAWQPLLDDDDALAEQTSAAIDAILTDIEAVETSLGRTQSASLADGTAGLALLRSYAFRALARASDAAKAEHHLDHALDVAARAPLQPTLYSGFPGIAWTLEHLQPGGDDPNEAVDEALLDYLDVPSWRREYDLISGLVGIGVYALERLPRFEGGGPAARCLTRVLDRLDELTERGPMGISWFTPPSILPAHQKKIAPHGYYNLGVAHGVPGVIALLSGMVRAGVERARALELLEGAVRWLLAQKLSEERSFPSWVGPGITPEPTRVAWCYGDPGIAAVLLVAARSAWEPAWEREALSIAHRVAALAINEVRWINDAGLCHGAGGLAHLFNRMAQTTGDERLHDAARAWFAHALEFRRPGQGIGGFTQPLPQRSGSPEPPLEVADPSLLTGAAGIALALLGAISTVEPSWDRIMQISLR